MALTRPKYSQIYDTDWKQSVRLATTADVGNLFLANVQPTTVDSVSLSVNDRILVKDQTNARQNGIYIVRSTGTGSNGWWARTLDAAQSGFVTSGLSVVVSEGATNNGREYRLTTPDPITLDTTELSFTLIVGQPGGANTYVQFNDMNILTGSPGLTFNKTSNVLTISGFVNSIGNVLATGIIGNTITAGVLTANVITTVLTRGADNNFQLTAQNGVGQNLLNTEVARFGINYGGTVGATGTGWDSFIQYIRGSSSQNGSMSLWASNTRIANITSSGITVTGNILPSANVTYDLGSPTQRFRSAYFSGNTVYIGGQSISVDPAGTWTFTSHGANISMGATTPLDPPSANIAGNITIGGTLLANNSPGQNGYVLRSTGAGITWAAPSAGTGIDSGTSNVSILGTGADVVTTIGGNIITRTSSTAFTINGNLAVNGNLFVNGNVTTINANNLSINDSLIYLADDNPSDIIDIGFVSAFTPGGGSYQHTGFVRDASDGVWKLFAGVADEPTTTVNFDNATYSTIRVGNIYAGGTTANDNRFLQSTAGGLAWTAATSISSGTTSATADATSILITAENINSARFYKDIAYIYPDLDLGANLLVAGVADVTGNLSAAYFIGDGSQLTGLPEGYSNVQVATYLPIYRGQVNVASTTTAIINGGTDGQGNIGASGATFNTVFAKASQAQYADLAEIYTSDQQYPAGTVVVFGGDVEVTQSRASHDTRIAGVISTDPAYLMNSTATGVPVALQGRVPCRVLGPVSQGDRVVSSHIAGVAQGLDPLQYQPGCIIGKALQAIESTDISIIEVVVGRV